MSNYKLISNNLIGKFFRKIKIREKRKQFRNRPKLQVSSHQYKLIKFGSKYGGWTFIDTPTLSNAKILSCGLGEDASFDVEFASKYNAEVIIVDPTPRAIQHFAEISKNFGKRASTPYSNNGKQPISSYDLSIITIKNLKIYPKALWKENKNLHFYAPPNKDHVSHSIINFQNSYRTDTDFIEVEAATIDRVLRTYNFDKVELLKLDIEGAEIEVIKDTMEKNIFPSQLLVEYDELNLPSQRFKERIEACHKLLLSKGYHLINFDEPSNFLYTNLT